MNDPALMSISKYRPWGIGATLTFSGVIFGTFLLIQSLVLLIILSSNHKATVPAPDAEQNGFVLTIATLIASPICVALIVAIVRLRKRVPLREYLGLRRPPDRALLEWCLITVVFSVAIDLLKMLADLPLVPSSMIEIYKTAELLPLFCLAAIVAAPVFEEIFFRGFIYQGTRYSFLGISGAIILPAFLWALIHLQYDWLNKTGIFIFGVVLGFARVRTRSTYIPIAMHALNNLLALIQAAGNLYFS